MTKLFLGLDTSNYTTSAALVNEAGEVLWNQKKLLPVKEGERGLRQSDAVFHHVKALTETAAGLRQVLSEHPGQLTAIGVSRSPRDGADSYMPCFLVGAGVGEILSAATGVPLYGFSHQAGHIMAVAHSACEGDEALLEPLLAAPLLAFHVSGGTTDILLAQPAAEKLLTVTRIGGTLDINAGQLIDRTGVRMGFGFPCGAAMDPLALAYNEKLPRIPKTVKGLDCNLSGLENKAVQLWEETHDPALASAWVLHAVGDTILALTEELLNRYPGLPILYAGGVMSSRTIKQKLSPYGRFAKPAFSSDNAAGTALLARKAWKREAVYG